MTYFHDFHAARNYLKAAFASSGRMVKTERWQALDISKRPEATMHELLFESLYVPLREIEDLDHWRKNIHPHLPWADAHFHERVCGMPINPGREWKNWPYAHSAAGHLDSNGKFNHNYMERYWPKRAGTVSVPTVEPEDFIREYAHPAANHDILRGIRHQYGDLGDLVRLLAFESLTRQAYMPIFFPEDTGTSHSGRKPCTLGYHFIVRDNKLSVVYYIRSCDFIRHYSDDIYLTVRLLLWIIDQCRQISPMIWNDIHPGTFVMHITSLHMFRNDYITMFGGEK